MGCAAAIATLNPLQRTRTAPPSLCDWAAVELNMRAETQNLVEEIKQSVRLLRRHL
jgi:hypothetical protein